MSKELEFKTFYGLEVKEVKDSTSKSGNVFKRLKLSNGQTTITPSWCISSEIGCRLWGETCSWFGGEPCVGQVLKSVEIAEVQNPGSRYKDYWIRNGVVSTTTTRNDIADVVDGSGDEVVDDDFDGVPDEVIYDERGDWIQMSGDGELRPATEQEQRDFNAWIELNLEESRRRSEMSREEVLEWLDGIDEKMTNQGGKL